MQIFFTTASLRQNAKMVERNTNMKIWVAGTTLKSEYRTHLNIMKTIAPPNLHDALQLALPRRA